MIIEIDFNSDEALYMQLRNQIIMGIATSQFHEGDSLPSVRQLADTIGIGNTFMIGGVLVGLIGVASFFIPSIEDLRNSFRK